MKNKSGIVLSLFLILFFHYRDLFSLYVTYSKYIKLSVGCNNYIIAYFPLMLWKTPFIFAVGLK